MEKYYFTFDTIDADLNFPCENSDYIVIMAHSYCNQCSNGDFRSSN